jgi:hypothetical protein
MMEFHVDAEAYMSEIVDRTINDFKEHQASRRHAFLACVATFHCIDYLAHPRKSANLRKKFRKNPDFAIVDGVAHAFKHVKSDGNVTAPQAREQPLRVTAVFSRPPARAGVMQAGLSRVGDPVGGVEIWGESGSDLLGVVMKAAEFLRTMLPASQDELSKP